MVFDSKPTGVGETSRAMACCGLCYRDWKRSRTAVVVGANILVGTVFPDALVVHAARSW